MISKIPKVSVIISTYNSEKFIEKRLINLIGQTIFNEIEIIIIDSASKQNEKLVIEPYLKQYSNIKYIRTENRETIYKAWNRGIKISNGIYITNGNADDILRKDALEILAQVLDNDPYCALVYADQYITNAPNSDFDNLSSYKKQKWNNFSYDRLLEACLTGPQPMWRASLHNNDNIWFNEEYEVAGDYEFACNVALKYKIQHIPEYLGIYYLSNENSNKEYQDNIRTFEETFKIKNYYTDKYLAQINENLFYEKYTYYSKWTKRNVIFFYFWKLMVKVFNNDLRLPTREFVFWYASKMNQILGNNKKAKQIISKYLSSKNSKSMDKLSESMNASDNDYSISIIMPTYNRPIFLKDALDSLVNQTYKNFEVIICNNGEIDINNIIEEYSNKLKIKYILSDIKGSVSHAKNLAILNTCNNYIAFLDDDDWYHSNHLETLVNEMKGDNNNLIVYSDAYVEFQEVIDGNYQTTKKFIEYSKEFSHKLLLIKDYIFTPCLLINKNCFKIVGLFDENLKTDEDMDLWIRMSKYYFFKHIKVVTCSVRRTNTSTSLTKDWSLMYKNAQYVYKKHKALVRCNPLVIAGQFYYLNMRKSRAKKYKNGSFNYNY